MIGGVHQLAQVFGAALELCIAQRDIAEGDEQQGNGADAGAEEVADKEDERQETGLGPMHGDRDAEQLAHDSQQKNGRDHRDGQRMPLAVPGQVGDERRQDDERDQTAGRRKTSRGVAGCSEQEDAEQDGGGKAALACFIFELCQRSPAAMHPNCAQRQRNRIEATRGSAGPPSDQSSRAAQSPSPLAENHQRSGNHLRQLRHQAEK